MIQWWITHDCSSRFFIEYWIHEKEEKLKEDMFTMMT